MNILSLPNPEEHIPERWKQYAAWLACQANPSLSYQEHAHLPQSELENLKQSFADSAGMPLDDYIRLRRISFLLSRSQSHSQYRSELAVAMMETPLGQMLAVFSEKGLCMLEFVEQKGVESELLAVQREKQALFVWRENTMVELLRDELKQYFSGSLKKFSVPLDLVGTEFQREVWQTLQAIPYGETRSYGQQAAYLSKPNGARAVAAANSQNKISILVPCHRVIGSDGHLTGYAGGVGRKKALLDLENGQLALEAAATDSAISENILPTPVGFGWSRS